MTSTLVAQGHERGEIRIQQFGSVSSYQFPITEGV